MAKSNGASEFGKWFFIVGGAYFFGPAIVQWLEQFNTGSEDDYRPILTIVAAVFVIRALEG